MACIPMKCSSTSRHQRGVVLLAAVAVLVLLAISSAAYLQLATLDRVSQKDDQPELDIVQASMISRVESVLLDDVAFEADGTKFFANGSDWWDYPYTNPHVSRTVASQSGNPLEASGGVWDDAWLASTVMDFDLDRDGSTTTDDYGWRHISNIEGIFLRIPRHLEADKDGTDVPIIEVGVSTTSAPIVDTNVRYTDMIKRVFTSGTTEELTITEADVNEAAAIYGGDWPDQWYEGFDPTKPLIVKDTVLDKYEELGVDADGDGVPDSMWTWAPISVLGSYQYVSAYRIVDMSAMIPINSINANTGVTSPPDPSLDSIDNYDSREKFRGYFSNHLDLMPLLVKAHDSTGSNFSHTVIQNRLNSLFNSYGYNNPSIPIGSGLLSDTLSAQNKDPNENVTDLEFDTYPYNDPENVSGTWYPNPTGSIDNSSEYWTKKIRSNWVSNATYDNETQDTHELLFRFGLNRPTVESKLEIDLAEILRKDAKGETSFQDVAASGVDTRGDLIAWFIGEPETAVTKGMEHQSAVFARKYVDIRKMLSTYSGHMKIKSPILEDGEVLPETAFSLTMTNKEAKQEKSHAFLSKGHAADAQNDDELIGFYTDWNDTVNSGQGYWFSHLETNNGYYNVNKMARGQKSHISDYIDYDSAMGVRSADGNNKSWKYHHGHERLPRLSEFYFQQAFKIVDSSGSLSWSPNTDNSNQLMVFELRNPYLQPIYVRDFNPRDKSEEDRRWQIIVNTDHKDYTDGDSKEWIFGVDTKATGSTGAFYADGDQVAIPPDGVAFFYYEDNPVDETDDMGVTQSGTGGKLDDVVPILNTSMQDKYGRDIPVYKLKLLNTAIQGDHAYPETIDRKEGRLYVNLAGPSEESDGDADDYRRKIYDRLFHLDFRIHSQYATAAVLPEGVIRNVQMSIARDGRGRRYIANPRNTQASGGGRSFDSNVFIKQRMLPGVTDESYVGAFYSDSFCSVDQNGDLVNGNDLIHQLGQNRKAINSSKSSFIRLADPMTFPNVNKWEDALDKLQLTVANHPMLSDIELALLPAHLFSHEGRGAELVASELLGEKKWASDEDNTSNDSNLDPRMWMWNLDATAAYQGFDTSLSYLGSVITVAPPAGTLMDYFDVMAMKNDERDNDGNGSSDDKLDIFMPYRINVNTAPLHHMVLACPIPETHDEIEMLFRQIERYRDGADGDATYDGSSAALPAHLVDKPIKAVRSAITGMPISSDFSSDPFAFDDARLGDDGVPGIKSLSELLWINPGEAGDPLQSYTNNSDGVVDHITELKWGDMQRYGYDGENNADLPVDIYPFTVNYGALSDANYKTIEEYPGGPTFEALVAANGDPIDFGVDDNEERLHRYQFLSGTYSTRSDIYAVYGYLRAYRTDEFSAGPVGSRRFIAVFDRHDFDQAKVLGSVYNVD